MTRTAAQAMTLNRITFVPATGPTHSQMIGASWRRRHRAEPF